MAKTPVMDKHHAATDTKIDWNGHQWEATRDGHVIASDDNYHGLIATLNKMKSDANKKK